MLSTRLSNSVFATGVMTSPPIGQNSAAAPRRIPDHVRCQHDGRGQAKPWAAGDEKDQHTRYEGEGEAVRRRTTGQADQVGEVTKSSVMP